MGEGAGDRVLTRLHSVRERIGDSLSAHPNELVAVFTRLIFLPCKLLCAILLGRKYVPAIPMLLVVLHR
jgi:sucrose synthase